MHHPIVAFLIHLNQRGICKMFAGQGCRALCNNAFIFYLYKNMISTLSSLIDTMDKSKYGSDIDKKLEMLEDIKSE
jgi:hypothetical protein